MGFLKGERVKMAIHLCQDSETTPYKVIAQQ